MLPKRWSARDSGGGGVRLVVRTPGVIVEWAEAAERIRELAAARRGGRDLVVVGVTGRVASGKSTLARRLSACVLSTDDYLPDYDLVPYEERDEPEHADLPRLVADLSSLLAGRATEIPVWSFRTHRRESSRVVEPPSAGGLIVVEGLHALADPVASALNVGVFVASSAAVRWSRWEAIERDGARGWGVEVAREFFERVAEPSFGKREAGFLARADVVVRNG